jgi:leucyl aminopeptidase
MSLVFLLFKRGPMELLLKFDHKSSQETQLKILPAFLEKGKKEKQLDIKDWDSSDSKWFHSVQGSDNVKGDRGELFWMPRPGKQNTVLWGLGERKMKDKEVFRKLWAGFLKTLRHSPYETVSITSSSLSSVGDPKVIVPLMTEIFYMTQYSYHVFLKEKPQSHLKKVILVIDAQEDHGILKGLFEESKMIITGLNFARDLVNDPPNVLNSEVFAKRIESDAKKNLKSVKVHTLGKPQLQKEGMNLFLSVNQGSAFGPRLVHLHYKPSKMKRQSKHIALVGKGLTFDTGGYSLKPAQSMMGMKFDMAGAATVYAAFRNAVLCSSPHEISCFLGITDNMVSSEANTPDSIFRSRAGITVEIQNTDAEGRLVLADVMDYACDFKPDIMIDAATLTGACVRALGGVCGIMGNNRSLIEEFIKMADTQGEYTWFLPIYDEYREDMKSKLADLKNIGSSNAGAQKAAVFLEKFVRPGIDWMHLDIAGVASDLPSIPYYPSVGATGHMIRTLTQFLLKD